MASLSVGNGYTIITFSDISVVLCALGDTYVEHLLEHGSLYTKEDDSDGVIPTVCSSLSHCGGYFTCCIFKDLYLWSTKEWKLISKRQVNRSASAIIFTPKDDKIVVADKSGDVFLFSVENATEAGDLLLGHISMLLDVLITPDSKYIVTSDRDEKIRVSYYPNAYNIHSYCLGHEEFVTCLSNLPHNNDVLISGSGDGTIRFWDFEVGRQLLCHMCSEGTSGPSEENKIVISKIVSFKYKENVSVLCVQLLTFQGILIYNISSGENKSDLKCSFKQIISLESEPWCICFNNDCLWVFKQNAEECLSAYTLCSDKKDFFLDSSIMPINNILKRHSTILKSVFKKDRQLNILYKRRFDNVQEYLKRKMVRMETDSKKPKHQLSVTEGT